MNTSKERKYMFVRIPLTTEHDGFQGCVRKIRIRAFCPKCGAPRGKVFSHNMRSYDGSRYVMCDGWKNPCGHTDYYSEVAKDIIRDYKIVVEGDHTTVCSVPEENRCINVLKLNEQAEQYLKEVSE